MEDTEGYAALTDMNASSLIMRPQLSYVYFLMAWFLLICTDPEVIDTAYVASYHICTHILKIAYVFILSMQAVGIIFFAISQEALYMISEMHTIPIAKWAMAANISGALAVL
jgi:hypothetical protein